MSAYLHAEQQLGRVHENADPEAVAAMLLGACFQRAFLRQFLAEHVDPIGEERFAENVVGSLVRSLSPDSGWRCWGPKMSRSLARILFPLRDDVGIPGVKVGRSAEAS